MEKELKPYPKVIRKPVLLHEDTVALINIYRKPEQSSLDYAFFWEQTGNDPYNCESEAEDFAKQIEEYCSINFMDELSKAFKSRVDDHWKETKRLVDESRNKTPEFEPKCDYVGCAAGTGVAGNGVCFLGGNPRNHNCTSFQPEPTEEEIEEYKEKHK